MAAVSAPMRQPEESDAATMARPTVAPTAMPDIAAVEILNSADAGAMAVELVGSDVVLDMIRQPALPCRRRQVSPLSWVCLPHGQPCVIIHFEVRGGEQSLSQ